MGVRGRLSPPEIIHTHLCAWVIVLAAWAVLALPGAGLCLTTEDQLFLAADAWYQGDFPRAAQAFGDALTVAPESDYALSRLGACLAILGRQAEAAAKLEAVLARRPDHLFARTWLAVVRLRTGQPDQAEAELGHVLRLAPDYPPALLFLGLSRLESGDAAGALGIFQRLTERDHPDADVHAALASLFVRLGLLDAAKLEWERALALRPNEPGWLTALGVVLARQGKERLALTSFEQVLAMGEAGPRIGPPVGPAAAGRGRAKTMIGALISGLAWQAAVLGNAQDALGLCRTVLRADPTQAACIALSRSGGRPEATPEAGKPAPPRPAAPPASPPPPAGAAPPAKPAAAAQPIVPARPVQANGLARLRSGPGTEFEVLATLRSGLPLSAGSEQAGWTEVATASGTKGFVRSDLLAPADAAAKPQAETGDQAGGGVASGSPGKAASDAPVDPKAAPQQPAAEPAAAQERPMTVRTLAKLRSGPGAGFEVMMTLRAGFALSAAGERSGWTEVTTGGGRKGFVRSDLLTAPAPGQ